MSMNVGDKKGGAMADINVTPMADIMIVLLIIFMVITPMISKGVDVTLPKAGNTKEKKDEKDNITVGLTLKKEVFLKNVRLESQAELTPKLKELLEDLTEKVVYLKADENLEYSEVMKVMDLCREAGVEEVALIAERSVEG
ncbi:MAG: biopolymer transporter ExbD [Vicinamibacteria bacterium]|jgi:biopolymer transport protein ExbD|nr:biopolymer transporter ExbD [Vicinamibacteria bacterium]